MKKMLLQRYNSCRGVVVGKSFSSTFTLVVHVISYVFYYIVVLENKR